MMLWPMEVLETATHVMSDEGWCWCQPRIEEIPPDNEVTVHRHFWDRPEYAEDEQ